MSAIVKICGLSEARHVDAAVDAGAGLTGYVFFPPSPRNVSIEQAAALTARVPAGVRKVALTVDADDDLLARIIAGAGIDTLQLHGSESVARVDHVRKIFALPIIKAMPVSAAADVAAARAFEGHADMLLFDARPPKDATRPGGNAESFDWTLLQDIDFGVPWLLAGGLDASNVGRALGITGAPMVDVSSGVEDAPGQKAAQKIRDFIAAVKAV
ncbi:MAG: phosphoribosylanthranilate isomerase [Rhodospirillales bacterium]